MGITINKPLNIAKETNPAPSKPNPAPITAIFILISIIIAKIREVQGSNKKNIKAHAGIGGILFTYFEIVWIVDLITCY